MAFTSAVCYNSRCGCVGFFVLIISVIDSVVIFFFFFSSRRRHTRCSRDWSSDVCSSDLLVGVFHRFNREFKKERGRAEKFEMFSSVLDLEQFEAATDAEWVEQLERAIAASEITDRMNPWMRKVWQRRQCDYSWKAIAAWLGITEQQAKVKFYYGLQKIREIGRASCRERV